MASIEQIFLLVVGCAINGTVDTLRDVCRTSEMREVLYQNMVVDQRMPKFEEGHWYTFQMSGAKSARLEVLVKDKVVLQAGVEIIYPESPGAIAERHFKELAQIGNRHYGLGAPIDLGGIDNLNYGDTRSVFYIVKGNMNKHPFIVFRAGNRRFWP